MTPAVYRFDSGSRIHWLEFDGKPDQEIIDLLKKDGWRWSGYRKQWRTNRRFAKPPVGIEYTNEGECDYASERPDRLANAATRATDRSQKAYEHSNELVDGIPFGQPIIIGGRNQRTHEKTLERSRSAMDKSVEEGKKAEHLEYKARSSARHQAYKERPDVIARRIKRLKADITSIRNSMKHEPYGLWSARQANDLEKIAEIERAMAASDARQEEKICLIEQEIAENEQVLEEAGGLIADRLNIEVGDVIKGGWRGLCEVKKINKRNGEIMSYTCLPLTNTWNSKYVIPKDEVCEVAIRKGDVTSESVLMAKLEVRAGQTYTPKPEPEKKEFKVTSVEMVEVYDNRTSLFPTPIAIADQLAQTVPQGAYLILEPSAGTGSLANAVTRNLMERGQNHGMHCCEILSQLRRSLSERGYQVVGEDFLEYDPGYQYDCIIMNPPFKNTDWLDHVEHALELLKPGGTLSAIVPAGFAFREEKRIKAFRELVEEHGWWQYLPDDTFVESGTSVRTVMLVLHKPLLQEPEIEAVEPIGEMEQVTLWQFPQGKANF